MSTERQGACRDGAMKLDTPVDDVARRTLPAIPKPRRRPRRLRGASGHPASGRRGRVGGPLTDSRAPSGALGLRAPCCRHGHHVRVRRMPVGSPSRARRSRHVGLARSRRVLAQRGDALPLHAAGRSGPHGGRTVGERGPAGLRRRGYGCDRPGLHRCPRPRRCRRGRGDGGRHDAEGGARRRPDAAVGADRRPVRRLRRPRRRDDGGEGAVHGRHRSGGFRQRHGAAARRGGRRWPCLRPAPRSACPGG